MKAVFFGDSICVGQYVSPHLTWVARCAARVAEELGDGVLVVNSSVNGDTTRLALERMPADVQGYEPDLVVVQFGLNDCNRWETDRGAPRVSPAAFEANLGEIVDRAARFGAREVLLHTNHPTLRLAPHPVWGGAYEDGNRAYNEIVRRVAERREGVTLVDLDAAVHERVAAGEALERLLLPDGLHLAEAGHVVYADIVEPPLLAALRRLAE